MNKTIGIAGMGAIGSAVARALVNEGIEGYVLKAASDIDPPDEFDIPYVDFETLSEQCDLIIEALPPEIVPDLIPTVFKNGKDLVLISACTLLLYPEIKMQKKFKNSRIIVPSGALAGIDGVTALAQMGIKEAKIVSTKPPRGFKGAPYILEQKIDLSNINTKTCIFKGNAFEASKAFPANVNVAATLSLAGIGPEHTQVEIWADPEASGNSHSIDVIGTYSQITATVQNTPDPANPKSSMLAAQSVISVLKKLQAPLAIL